MINTLKSAWSVEFYTIPLYLSALYTAPNKETQDFIRSVSIDEMKHLFIASNVLNAIHDPSLVSGNAVPFDDPTLIPTYPNQLPVVLNAQNE